MSDFAKTKRRTRNFVNFRIFVKILQDIFISTLFRWYRLSFGQIYLIRFRLWLFKIVLLRNCKGWKDWLLCFYFSKRSPHIPLRREFCLVQSELRACKKLLQRSGVAQHLYSQNKQFCSFLFSCKIVLFSCKIVLFSCKIVLFSCKIASFLM